jgi:hypothetical protein
MTGWVVNYEIGKYLERINRGLVEILDTPNLHGGAEEYHEETQSG